MCIHFTLTGYPFSLSYGVNLLSSLTRFLSRALGFSPRLPVSVCGTGTYFLARGFSWQFGTVTSLRRNGTPLHASGFLLSGFA